MSSESIVAASAPKASRVTARWTLGVFFLGYMMIGVDRGIISIMIEPIKQEFGVTDTQIGLLSGLAFALFFAVASLPLGYLVDRWNRRLILAISLAFFSALTALAGWAISFQQLFLIRLGVGAGEAGGTPAMTSILADHFPPERRATALSVYYAGAPAAKILVLVVGGYMTMAYGWRSVFWAAGAAGLVLAAVILLSIKEPPRKDRQDGVEPLSYLATLGFIWRQPSLRHLLFTTALTSAVSTGTLTWAVSFLIRSHGMTVGTAGVALAFSFGVIGGVGTLASGPITDLIAKRDIRWRCWLLAGAQLAAAPAYAAFALSHSLVIALCGFAFWSVVAGALLGPLVSMYQGLVGQRMRGTVTALYTFLAHFVGVTLGPQIVGSASDLLRPTFGADSLRYSLLLLCALFFWAACHFALASRTLAKDMARAESTP
jgi:predicted MFS family arabinose efflux permease